MKQLHFFLSALAAVVVVAILPWTGEAQQGIPPATCTVCCACECQGGEGGYMVCYCPEAEGVGSTAGCARGTDTAGHQWCTLPGSSWYYCRNGEEEEEPGGGKLELLSLDGSLAAPDELGHHHLVPALSVDGARILSLREEIVKPDGSRVLRGCDGTIRARFYTEQRVQSQRAAVMTLAL